MNVFVFSLSYTKKLNSLLAVQAEILTLIGVRL